MGRLFTDTLGPNDNAEHVARRLLREKHGKNTLRCQIRLPLQVAARWYRALPKIRCSHSP
jgi:hypothetical protein